MSRERKYKFLACDFETTVYKGQVNTEVWASACVELGTEDVKIFHSIEETFDYFKSLKTNLICYYHNLKFDGSFWLSYLLVDLGYEQAVEKTGSGDTDIEFVKPNKMRNGTFSYSISDMGMWYSMKIKVNNYMIELRDSLKLLPFKLSDIGKSFKTKHQKLEMEYEGFRYAGCQISDSEKEYIANDVLVLKEALEVMFKAGHDKLTIGSCCLSEFKTLTGEDDYKNFFPNMYEVPIDKERHKFDNAGDWIRKSYKGGWCYLAKGKENKIYNNGITADVNSLYPSMMSSESGNRYPVGMPKFWTGNFIPEEAKAEDKYFFVRIKTRFYIKEGYLPFIQIKGSFNYKATEALESSDVRVYDRKKKEWFTSAYTVGFEGELQSTRVELTLTQTDYYLFLEHYHVIEFEIIDGCFFRTQIGIFDTYIEKYKKLKLESVGAMRTIAKLFLNNLYGKMATNEDSSFKYAYIKDDKSIGFYRVEANEKKPGYIPVGSAITSYARNFTIRAAQKNYHGKDKPGFIYADTDSIHCDLKPEELVGVPVHDKDFCHWKLESSWDIGLFVRQKTYIEHVVAENLEPIDNPFYNIKCAGMPDRCKDLFEKSMSGYEPQKGDKYDEEQLEFLATKRKLTDFKVGLKIPGKLTPKRIRGGVLLVNTTYELRE